MSRGLIEFIKNSPKFMEFELGLFFVLFKTLLNNGWLDSIYY